MHVTPDDVRRRFRDAPIRRLLAELYCLYLTFIFHPNNDHGRKAATLGVVGVWGLIEIGGAYGYATLPDQFYFLRLLIGAMVGRMWGIEIDNFAGIEFDYIGTGPETDGEDDPEDGAADE